MAKFENRFLTPIQDFTQSKIEKAKIQLCRNGVVVANNRLIHVAKNSVRFKNPVTSGEKGQRISKLCFPM